MVPGSIGVAMKKKVSISFVVNGYEDRQEVIDMLRYNDYKLALEDILNHFRQIERGKIDVELLKDEVWFEYVVKYMNSVVREYELDV
jgi:hypothetical protein